MKKLKTIDKCINFFNVLMAVTLLFSYVLPFVPPQQFAFLSVLSLGVPLLILINIAFVLYWLVKRQKQMLLSLIVLCIGYNYMFSLYKLTESNKAIKTADLSIMSYNVRLFNLYNWIENTNFNSDFNTFITDKNPDIIAFQEFHPLDKIDLSAYQFNYKLLQGRKAKYGQAIYSKYPIINSGSIKFKNTTNNAIFSDIVVKKDTIRVYNLHLQSLHISPDVTLNVEKSNALVEHIGEVFEKQQTQVEMFLAHKQQSPYKSIVCGDFNNTPYSYIYNTITKKLNDAFEIAGSGFGRTFDFKYFPTRIDYILTDKAFGVNFFEVFDKHLSDHYPIMAGVYLH